MIDNDIMNYKEAAEYLGYSVGTLRQKVFYKKIPCYRSMNGRIYFLKNELRDWLLCVKITPDSEVLRSAMLDTVRDTGNKMRGKEIAQI